MEAVGGIARGRWLDEIAEALPQRASAISRLFLAHTTVELSRTEANVMRALSERPRRITDLALAEGVTQPAMTLLVNRLEERGWVRRSEDPADRRAVLVCMSESGARVFEQLRTEYRALLHEEMALLDDDEVEVLARATEVLDGLVDRLSRADR
jgi:DNA-binding MarR family transcriptional regulator